VEALRIAVCLKQVPDTAELAIDPATKRLIRDGVRNVINPFDRRGLTEALNIKQSLTAHVTALTMGPPQAKDVLIEALALGCDEAVHLLDSRFAGADTLATSRTLAACLRLLRPDVILCGKYSVDSETSQVGPEVAELMGAAQITAVSSLSIEPQNRTVTALRETDEGFEEVATSMPVVVTATERLNKPRRPTEDEKSKIDPARIRIIDAEGLAGRTENFGAQGSPTRVVDLYEIKRDSNGILIEPDDPDEAAKAVLDYIIKIGAFSSWKTLPKKDGEVLVIDDHTVDAPSKSIWVIVEVARGRVRPVTYELLGKARQLASKIGGEVVAVAMMDTDPDMNHQLASYGADKILRITSPALSTFTSEPYTAGLVDAISKFAPHSVIFPSTAMGRDLAPRVAARMGLGLTSDCIDLQLDGQARLIQHKPAFGGAVVALIYSDTSPQMATVRPGILPRPTPNQARKNRLIEHSVNLDASLTKTRVLKRTFTSEHDSKFIEEADIAVGVGYGLGSKDNLPIIQNLADALGAAVVGTRKIVDMDWLPRHLQVGLTGTNISPKLYIAIGVSGALNHLVGVRMAKTVIAVNKDRNAAIMKFADLAVVGDLFQVVPRLTSKLRSMFSPPSGQAA
jgi:electron transfer flavoprotein alpha subunit